MPRPSPTPSSHFPQKGLWCVHATKNFLDGREKKSLQGLNSNKKKNMSLYDDEYEDDDILAERKAQEMREEEREQERRPPRRGNEPGWIPRCQRSTKPAPM